MSSERKSRSLPVASARALLLALALAGAAAAYLPQLDVDAWWIRFLAFPRIQLFLALAVVLVALVALPGRARPLSLFAMAAALAGLVGQALVLLPYAPFAPVQARGAEACQPDDRLRVAAVNVKMTNENASDLIDILREAAPDLILLQETDPWWDERLAVLEASHPHSKEYVTRNYFGIHLLSNRPLVNPEVRFLTSSRDPSIFTGVRMPSGQVVSFYGLHPRPPKMGQSSAQRDGQILAAALAIGEDRRPAILAGDLNAPPWSDVARHAARLGGLLDPRLGRGWMPTYPAKPLRIGWPIDQILFGDRFRVGEFRLLPAWSSDHIPILAELCLRSDAPAEQAAPAPRPGDVEAARRAVLEAQNAAAPSSEPAPGRQEPKP